MAKLPISNLKTVKVRDPRTLLDNERCFACLEDGTDIRYKYWPAQSVNNSTINYQTTPSDANTITDRQISITCPMRILIAALVQPGYSVLQPNGDAPRNFPFHSISNNFIMSANNTSITQQIAEMFHPLSRYNNSPMLKSKDYSGCPSAQDVSQNYSDVLYENINPLSADGNATQDTVKPRGGFSYKVVVNQKNETETAGTFYAVVDMVTVEMLEMSPLVWGKLFPHSSGFYNMTSLSWTFNILSNAGSRVWSHADIPISGGATGPSSVVYQSKFEGVSVLLTGLDTYGSYPVGGSVQGFSYPVGIPYLNVCSITPTKGLSAQLGPSKSLTWDYFSLVNYPKDQGTSIEFGKSKLLATDNQQISSIPRALLIFIRPTLGYYYNNSNVTETYYAIDAINITLGNRTGILSEASPQQLWQISRKNGCNIEYTDFLGNLKYTVGGNVFNNATSYGGVGAVLRLEFGGDIPLQEGICPGSIGQFSLQANVYARNINPRTQNYDVTTNPYPVENPQVTVNMICIYDGAITIPQPGVILPQTGVLTPIDVLEAENNQKISYEDIRDVNGGNVISGIKNVAKKIGDELNKANKYLRKNKPISKSAYAISNSDLSLPYYREAAKTIGDVADIWGYGEDEDEDEAYGGRKISKKNLKERAKRVRF